MGILMFIGVMMGGQTLMTSTIEEKSSRVVEVLLAAVSPLELMWGKLIGQLGVGLLVLAIYIGVCMLALFQFALIGLLDPVLIVWLFAFFLVTYLVFGALMLAIGAAVSQMADAQSLLGPVMLLLMTPYILSPIIGQAPNSAVQRCRQLHSAGQYLCDDGAPGIRLAAAVMAGAAVAAGRPGGRRWRGVVRGQDFPHRPADAWQAAEFRHPGKVGATGLACLAWGGCGNETCGLRANVAHDARLVQ